MPQRGVLGQQTAGQFDCTLAHFVAFFRAWTWWDNPQVNPHFLPIRLLR